LYSKIGEASLSKQVRRRVVEASLPVIILTRLGKVGIVSPTGIIKLLKEKYSLQISPGVVYPEFHKLERKKYIKRLPNRRKATYILTTKGQKVLSTIYSDSRIKPFQMAD
jgi:DNA-binding PadR family transcriptional regulator